MPKLTTIFVDFYGITLRVRGTYVPADPSVGVGSDFEIHDVSAKLKPFVSGVGETYAALADSALEGTVYDYLRARATEQVEDDLDAKAIAAYERAQDEAIMRSLGDV